MAWQQTGTSTFAGRTARTPDNPKGNITYIQWREDSTNRNVLLPEGQLPNEDLANPTLSNPQATPRQFDDPRSPSQIKAAKEAKAPEQAKQQELNRINRQIQQTNTQQERSRLLQQRAEISRKEPIQVYREREKTNTDPESEFRLRVQGGVARKIEARNQPTTREEFASSLLARQGYKVSSSDGYITAQKGERKRVIDFQMADAVIYDVPSTAKVSRGFEDRLSPKMKEADEIIERGKAALLRKVGYEVEERGGTITARRGGEVISLGAFPSTATPTSTSATAKFFNQNYDKLGSGVPKWYATGIPGKAYIAGKEAKARYRGRMSREEEKAGPQYTFRDYYEDTLSPPLVKPIGKFERKLEKKSLEAYYESSFTRGFALKKGFEPPEKVSPSSMQPIQSQHDSKGFKNIDKFHIADKIGSGFKYVSKKGMDVYYAGKGFGYGIASGLVGLGKSSVEYPGETGAILLGSYGAVKFIGAKAVTAGFIGQAAYTAPPGTKVITALETGAALGVLSAIPKVVATPKNIKAIAARGRAVGVIIADASKPIETPSRIQGQRGIRAPQVSNSAPKGLEIIQAKGLVIDYQKPGLVTTQPQAKGKIQREVLPQPPPQIKQGNLLLEEFGIEEAGIIRPTKAKKGKRTSLQLPTIGSRIDYLFTGSRTFREIEVVKPVSRTSNIETISFSRPIPTSKIKGRATPEQYALKLEAEGKIEYFPNIRKINNRVLANQGTKGLYFQEGIGGITSKPSIVISSRMHPFSRARQVTIAHEILHYKNPNWLLNLGENLPYGLQPTEIISFSLEGFYGKRGFKVSGDVPKSFPLGEGMIREAGPIKIEYPRSRQPASAKRKVSQRSPLVGFTKATIRSGFKTSDVYQTKIGRGIYGTIVQRSLLDNFLTTRKIATFRKTSGGRLRIRESTRGGLTKGVYTAPFGKEEIAIDARGFTKTKEISQEQSAQSGVAYLEATKNIFLDLKRKGYGLSEVKTEGAQTIRTFRLKTDLGKVVEVATYENALAENPAFDIKGIKKSARYRATAQTSEFVKGRDIQKTLIAESRKSVTQADKAYPQIETTKIGGTRGKIQGSPEATIIEVRPVNIEYTLQPSYKNNIRKLSVEGEFGALKAVEKTKKRTEIETRRKSEDTFSVRYSINRSRYKPVKALYMKSMAAIDGRLFSAFMRSRTGSLSLTYPEGSLKRLGIREYTIRPEVKPSDINFDVGIKSETLLKIAKGKHISRFRAYTGNYQKAAQPTTTKPKLNIFQQSRVRTRQYSRVQPKLDIFSKVKTFTPTMQKIPTRTRSRIRTKTVQRVIQQQKTMTRGKAMIRTRAIVTGKPPTTTVPLTFRFKQPRVKKERRRKGYGYFYREFELFDLGKVGK